MVGPRDNLREVLTFPTIVIQSQQKVVIPLRIPLLTITPKGVADNRIYINGKIQKRAFLEEGMLKKYQYYSLTILAILALFLTIGDMLLYSSNRSDKVEVETRRQYIQQSSQMQPLYDALLKGLVSLAAKNNDGQIRELLVSAGITYDFTPSTAEGKSNHADMNTVKKRDK